MISTVCWEAVSVWEAEITPFGDAAKFYRFSAVGADGPIKLRPSRKSAGRLQKLIGTPQLIDLALQGFDAFALATGQSIALAAVDILGLEPFQQGLGHAADLRCNGLNGSPSRGVSAKAIRPHPTLGESIGTAAEVAHGSCTDLPPVRK